MGEDVGSLVGFEPLLCMRGLTPMTTRNDVIRLPSGVRRKVRQLIEQRRLRKAHELVHKRDGGDADNSLAPAPVSAPEQAPALPEPVSVPVPLVDGSRATAMAAQQSEADAVMVALRKAKAALAVEAEARRAAERREAEAVAAAMEKHAALVSKENEWQQFQETNLAELARQKAAAERHAERADAQKVAAERRAKQADAAAIRQFDGASAHYTFEHSTFGLPCTHTQGSPFIHCLSIRVQQATADARSHGLPKQPRRAARRRTTATKLQVRSRAPQHGIISHSTQP